jgi:hypothetical protein
MTMRRSTIFGIAFFLAAISFPRGANAQRAPLPSGSKLSVTGDLILPSAATVEEKSEVFSPGRAENPPNRYVLPIVRPKSLENSEADIEAALNDLFDNWPDGRTKYAFYLQLLAPKN